MTDSTPESQIVNIRDRQQQLIRQRKQRFRRGAWRTLFIVGLTAGLGWAVCQPEWQIRQSSQVTLAGNEQIDGQTLEHLMTLQFPTSLIRFQPQVLASKLKTNAHISHVVVTRKLFPPRVKVVVQELPPIAMTECEGCTLILNPDQSNSITLGPANVWLLDERGVVLPADSYPKLEKAQQLPKLTLDAYLQPESKPTQSQASSASTPTKFVSIDRQKQAQWQQMYALLETSPVQVKHLNWQDPNKLMLQTKLGQIHIGPFSDRFNRQLQALDEMRTLPKSVDPQQIVYIDVENPESPVLELRNQAQPSR
ncbi:FtsQ-type POTRA domain-containing protein [Acaryochloris sp. IP29b_bin.148]|uniref:cell division protein FtsQ/DivIB n=1 Tax=Acaryochloris sp. IP29b_bin.148 TaxID=2969218 RepID=UPI0026112FA1|nr:FtsQ-type POTRA domain-containing protein [Acaryochloris sp. IP29b_bin.148]